VRELVKVAEVVGGLKLGNDGAISRRLAGPHDAMDSIGRTSTAKYGQGAEQEKGAGVRGAAEFVGEGGYDWLFKKCFIRRCERTDEGSEFGLAHSGQQGGQPSKTRRIEVLQTTA
jgi:hypothetical protein